jgi:hypothetical protein
MFYRQFVRNTLSRVQSAKLQEHADALGHSLDALQFMSNQGSQFVLRFEIVLLLYCTRDQKCKFRIGMRTGKAHLNLYEGILLAAARTNIAILTAVPTSSVIDPRSRVTD